MSSCLSGGRAAYGFDLDIVVKNSSSSSSPASSSRSTHSSPSSTLSESSNSPLAISTKRARAPRKRPNQTYNEAAALLSTAYPGVFSAKSIPKLCRNNSNRFFNSAAAAAAESPAELLLPPFPALGDAGFLLHQYVADEPSPLVELRPTSSSERSCLSPVEFREPSSPPAGLDDDFDAESILDEEVGEGIDSIMGNLTVDANGGGGGANAYLGSAAMGHGFGRMFKFGYTGNMRRALRKADDGEWWRSPTVDVGTCRVEVLKIAPKLKPASPPAPPAADKKKKKVQKVEKVLDRASKLEQKAEAEAPPPNKAEAAAASLPEQQQQQQQQQQPEAGKMKPVLSLKLDYEDVMKAWSGHASPFSDAGDSPESRADTIARLSQVELFPEGVREASVLRYKEKRRTRLFSKKIRYQVRKVNADCRPRMKASGRFVRRLSSLSP